MWLARYVLPAIPLLVIGCCPACKSAYKRVCCLLLCADKADAQVIMLVGVVIPIGWFVLKNKHSVQSAWSNMGNKRPL